MILTMGVLDGDHAAERGGLPDRPERRLAHPGRPRRQARLRRRPVRACRPTSIRSTSTRRTPQWWETCSNDKSNSGAGTPVPVPGATTGATYSYTPVPANGATACSTTDPVGSLIDNSTGTLRMAFTGYAGNATRSIVASFRTLSPLSFLWYTVYETEDTSITGTSANCNRFYYQSPGPSSTCDIYWVTGDHMNGPDVHPGPVPDLTEQRADLRAQRDPGSDRQPGADQRAERHLRRAVSAIPPR